GEYIGYVGSNSIIENAGNAPQANNNNSGPFILSNRERAVLMLVAAGLTAEEIATKLAIAARTVEYHIHSSARKLKSNNRVQTVAKAAVLGEIDLSSANGL
ncbi:MAG TPA: helix-turn-helix transcriptional regulator, partial [Devosia sp.]